MTSSSTYCNATGRQPTAWGLDQSDRQFPATNHLVTGKYDDTLFPIEILAQIFAFCDPNTFPALNRTCRIYRLTLHSNTHTSCRRELVLAHVTGRTDALSRRAINLLSDIKWQAAGLGNGPLRAFYGGVANQETPTTQWTLLMKSEVGLRKDWRLNRPPKGTSRGVVVTPPAPPAVSEEDARMKEIAAYFSKRW